MPDASSPRAARLATPRWLDTRLVLGVLLVLASVAAGAKVVSSADHYQRVWVAKHDLVPGERLTADDLVVGRARLYADGHAYVTADKPVPDGYVVVRGVGAGELLPFHAVAQGPPADVRLVTVPVQPGHLPPGLAKGDAVDVYVTVKSTGNGSVRRPRLVLSAAPVQSRDSGSRGFAAATSTESVVLAVPRDRVADIVAAVESGEIDLVHVPAAVAADRVPAWGPGS